MSQGGLHSCARHLHFRARDAARHSAILLGHLQPLPRRGRSFMVLTSGPLGAAS